MEKSIINAKGKFVVNELNKIGLSDKNIFEIILDDYVFNIDINHILTENIYDEQHKISIKNTIKNALYNKIKEYPIKSIYLITTAYSKKMSQYSLNDYMDKIKKIYENIFDALTSDIDDEEKTGNINNILCNEQLMNEPQNIIMFLRIINNISLYHYRSSNFIDKIEDVILKNKNKLETIDKKDILYIFRNNKKLLLFLFNEKIIEFKYETYNLLISLTPTKMMYFDYFLDMILEQPSQYYNLTDEQKQIIDEANQSENHKPKQKNGENDDFICELIRNDSIEFFIQYLDKMQISLTSHIVPSIYETNLLLIKSENVSYIEYAAFFGSLQVFNYLKKHVELQTSLWPFAIHGKNAEIFNYLEEQFKDNTDWLKCFEIAIKCHNNENANYILNNYLTRMDNIDIINSIYGIKYYNLPFIKNNNITLDILIKKLSNYDYYDIINKLIYSKFIDINDAYLYLIEADSIEMWKLIIEYVFKVKHITQSELIIQEKEAGIIINEYGLTRKEIKHTNLTLQYCLNDKVYSNIDYIEELIITPYKEKLVDIKYLQTGMPMFEIKQYTLYEGFHININKVENGKISKQYIISA